MACNITCKSGNEYKLDIKWPEYKGLLRQMRRRATKDQKAAMTMQSEVATQEDKEAAAEICLTLSEDLEDMGEAAISAGLGGQDLGELADPQDVQEMIEYLVGKASGADTSPFAGSEDMTQSS